MLINTTELHLWFCYPNKINEPQLLRHYFAILNEEEKARYQNFYFEKHRHEFLIAHSQLRLVLSHYIPDIKPAMWEFNTNKYGKPFIDPKYNLFFNLTHTTDMIAVVIARHPLVGVDVENLQRETKVIDLAQHYFSKEEINYLRTVLPVEQHQSFFKIWTLKEAYIKAVGVGISLSLDKFAFFFEEEIRIKIKDQAEDETQWKFWQGQINDTHLWAVALKSAAKKYLHSLIVRETIPGVNISSYFHDTPYKKNYS